MTVASSLTTAPARLGIGIIVAAIVLSGIAAWARPDMMMSGMRMIRGLVVGFGL